MSSPDLAPAGPETPVVPAPSDVRPYRRPSPATRATLTWAAAGLAAAASAGPVLLGSLTPTTALTLTAVALQVLVAVPIALIDHRHHLIPNWLVAVLAAGTAGALAVHPGLILPGLLAAAAVGVGMLVLNLIGAMGMGDVKLAAVCALAWGVHGPAVTALAFAAGFATALPATLIHRYRHGPTARVPLGPWILAGSVITLLWSLTR